MPSDSLDSVLARFGHEAVARAVRADLDDASEIYPPELLRQHLDADRVRDDLLPEYEKQARSEGHGADSRQVAHARLDVLLEDWDQLQTVLEDRLAGYLDLDAAAQELTKKGAWAQPGVLSRLDAALEILGDEDDEPPEFTRCESCGKPTGVLALCAACRGRYEL